MGYFLDEIVLTGDEDSLAHVLDDALEEELAVLCQSNCFQLGFDYFGLLLETGFDGLPQLGEDTL